MELVKYEVKNRVVWLTLNKPEKRNALSQAMVLALSAAIDQAVAEESNRVIVITGEGKVFCSGADLEALQTMQTNTFDQNLEDSQFLKSLFNKIVTCPLPIISAVQGAALAGGCGLATVADFCFAAPEILMGYTEVRIGFIPALVSAYLVKRIGEARARVLLLSGDLIKSEEAAILGLITKVVPLETLYDYTQEFAEKLARQNSKEAMAATKKLLVDFDGYSLAQATEMAALANANARATEDCKAGIHGFLNKTPVTW